MAHSRTGHVACIHKYVRIRKELFKSNVIISVNQKFNEIIFKFIENSTSESPGHPGRKTCRSPIPLDYRKRRLNWEMGGGASNETAEINSRPVLQ